MKKEILRILLTTIYKFFNYRLKVLYLYSWDYFKRRICDRFCNSSYRRNYSFILETTGSFNTARIKV